MLRLCAALTLCLTLPATTAAQEPAHTPGITLTPVSASRWDVAAHVTWLGEHLEDQVVEWDRWYEVASGGVSVGYYWTTHLKLELDVATSTTGESYSIQPIPIAGPSSPLLQQRDHHFRATTAAAGLNYQFLENAWFHPFLGTGIELLRERERVETMFPIVSTRDPRAPIVISPPATETHVDRTARPFVAGGFKVYLSERAFIRTDLRMSWSADGLTAVAWRSGIGVDF
jgi:hypothetical protein